MTPLKAVLTERAEHTERIAGGGTPTQSVQNQDKRAFAARTPEQIDAIPIRKGKTLPVHW